MICAERSEKDLAEISIAEPRAWVMRKNAGFRKSARSVGPSSWSSSIGKATQMWRNPRKPRSMAKRKGW